MMDRDEAYEELKIRLSDEDLLRHSLAVEAVMKEFAGFYNADSEMWALTGLLHDIDYERTAGNPEKHSIVGAEILENFDIDGAIVYSVRAHNDFHKIPRKRKMDKVLYAADHLTHLIVSVAKGLEDKKLSRVTVDLILNCMENNMITGGLSLDRIRSCHELNMALSDFVEMTLTAMRKVSKDLAL
jgi:putative nucleotidyltransferase with HDIG domain